MPVEINRENRVTLPDILKYHRTLQEDVEIKPQVMQLPEAVFLYAYDDKKRKMVQAPFALHTEATIVGTHTDPKGNTFLEVTLDLPDGVEQSVQLFMKVQNDWFGKKSLHSTGIKSAELKTHDRDEYNEPEYRTIAHEICLPMTSPYGANLKDDTHYREIASTQDGIGIDGSNTVSLLQLWDLPKEDNRGEILDKANLLILSSYTIYFSVKRAAQPDQDQKNYE